jgi:hypothetical protein
MLSGCLYLFGRLLHQCSHTLAGVSALRDPMLDSLLIETQAFLTTGSNGVVETETLKVTPITSVAAVSYHDVIKRPLFSATSGKTNGYHVVPLNIFEIVDKPADGKRGIIAESLEKGTPSERRNRLFD